jgi:tricarballylate dehydrogenase
VWDVQIRRAGNLAEATWDLVIAGGGNAALCAAITAAEAGARVLILESAPKAMRGGNSRHTRNFRCMHGGPLSVLTDSYGKTSISTTSCW